MLPKSLMAPAPLKNAFPAKPPFSREDVHEFCAAGKLGDLGSLKKLLEKFGAAILNERDGGGDTALTWAAWTGQKDAAVFLLAQGAAINAPGMQDKTALIWAAQGGKTEVVDLLLKKGADINIRDASGQTALDLCDKNSQLTVAKQIRDWVETQDKIAAQKKLEEEARALTAERLARLKEKAPKIRIAPKPPGK